MYDHRSLEAGAVQICYAVSEERLANQQKPRAVVSSKSPNSGVNALQVPLDILVRLQRVGVDGPSGTVAAYN